MLSNVIKGIIIAVSMLIPGVSGGTTALMRGIYYKLIDGLLAYFMLFFIGIILATALVLPGIPAGNELIYSIVLFLASLFTIYKISNK